MNNSIRTAAKTMAAVIAAGAMAVAPVAGTINFGAMTAMAADAVDATVSSTISGLQGGEKIHAYKIVQVNSDYSYSFVNGVENVLNPADSTDTEVTIANLGTTLTKEKINALATSQLSSAAGSINLSDELADNGKVTKSEDGKTATLTLGAGSYLILIENEANASVIYNPMVLSNGFDATSTLRAGSLNPTATTGATTYTDNTAKYTTITPHKQIAKSDDLTGASSGYKQTGTDSQGATADTTLAPLSHADDLQVGDIGTFLITSQIPTYTDAYKQKSLEYYIVDNQDDTAFSAPRITNVQYLDNGTWTNISQVTSSMPKSDTTEVGYVSAIGTVTDGTFSTVTNGKDFQITFTKGFIQAHFGAQVRVIYTATLEAGAAQGLKGNEDNLTVKYTNDLFDHTATGTDKVTEYSFPINVEKVDENNTAIGKADNKTAAKFKITRVEKQTATGTTTDGYTEDQSAFKVAADIAQTTGTNRESEVDSTGYVSFSNLDEGYYMIEETQAPAGYQLNQTKYYIHVIPTYDTDTNGNAILSSYTIKNTDKAGTDSGEVETDSTKKINTNEDTRTLKIQDTKIGSLPSTGARSALILTIAGIAVMITVMAASRRKKIAD